MEKSPKINSSIDFLNTKFFKSYEKKESQYDFYVRNNSSPEILKLIDNESKSFGSLMENVISEVFNLEKRLNEQHDGLFDGKKIEIKSARYWINTKNDCKWQHIELDYDYDICILSLIDFHDIYCWAISKSDLLKPEMIENKIISKQGKQGYWFKKSSIEKYLHPIKNKEDLQEFINTKTKTK